MPLGYGVKVAMRVAARLFLLAATAMVCLAQLNPWGAQYSARAVRITGRVSVIKDTVPWALNENDLVHPRQVIVTGEDGSAEFQLPDGSKFEVFPNSRFVFRENAPNWTELLDLLIGRVKIHIEKFGGKPNPNRLRTPTAVISVRGTTFDVTAEDEGDTTLVIVEEGQVAVQHALLPYSEPKLLNPGEYIRVYKNQPLADKKLDRGAVIERALRAAAEASYQILISAPRGGTTPKTGGGGGPVLTGDTRGTTPPSGTPAPPPSQGQH